MGNFFGSILLISSNIFALLFLDLKKKKARKEVSIASKAKIQAKNKKNDVGVFKSPTPGKLFLTIAVI